MSSLVAAASGLRGAYPEREDERLSRLDEIAERLAGAVTRRWRAQRSGLELVPARVDLHAAEMAAASEAELRAAAAGLRLSLREGPFADAAVARRFALVRGAGPRA